MATEPKPVAFAAATTPAVVATANKQRTGLTICNGNLSATLYIAWGSDVTTSLYTAKLVPGALYELPLLEGGRVYKGVLTGVWSAGTGLPAMVTETDQ